MADRIPGPTAKQEDTRMDRRTFIGYGTLAASVLAGGKFAWARDQEAKGSPGATIETTAGKVRGTSQGKVSAFKGIPYGASTAGSMRFMLPANPQPWTGVRDAFDLGHRSPQNPSTLIPEVAAVDSGEPMGEDCLCLNVWTPGVGAGHKRPVMVWLHGGGFSNGSGGYTIYDGANLAARHDVVTITVNHRLNAFGYLFLADLGGEKYINSSNLGMLDIVLALEWVRDNISAFGGDPGNVTIFGQSGGGRKVSTLMAMPSAKGLFHRAIVESGASPRGVPHDDANKSTESFLAKLGLKPDQVDQLQKLPMDQILAGMAGGGPGGNAVFRMEPVVDGRTLPANPFDPVATDISANVPLLIGSTRTEVGFFPGTPLDPIDEAALHTRVKQSLRSDDAAADRVIVAYRKDQPNISNIDIALELASDLFAWNTSLTEAERKAALGKAPAYMYYFTWNSPVREGKLKAFHTLEIPFIFDNVDAGSSMTGTGQDRYALEDKMSSAWVAFARTGNPNCKGLPNWPAYDAKQRATMFFDNECKLVDDPRPEARLALSSFRT
jgi:para-nitrobenzyl esterase